jgi:hypothetical protein
LHGNRLGRWLSGWWNFELLVQFLEFRFPAQRPSISRWYEM